MRSPLTLPARKQVPVSEEYRAIRNVAYESLPTLIAALDDALVALESLNYIPNTANNTHPTNISSLKYSTAELKVVQAHLQSSSGQRDILTDEVRLARVDLSSGQKEHVQRVGNINPSAAQSLEKAMRRRRAPESLPEYVDLDTHVSRLTANLPAIVAKVAHSLRNIGSHAKGRMTDEQEAQFAAVASICDTIGAKFNDALHVEPEKGSHVMRYIAEGYHPSEGPKR